MATTIIRGKIYEVSPVTLVGKNNDLKKQTIIVNVPPRVDDFGDVKGKEQFWEIAILGDDCDKFNIKQETHELKKAEFKMYLDSDIYKQEGKKDIYPIQAKLADFKFL